MALSLFTRTTVIAPEDWTPDGTVVVQRYRSLGGAIVLVYTADTSRSSTYYATACLGCTYREAGSPGTNPLRLTEDDAAILANEHAATCRALQRPLPARPDDAQAAKMIRSRLWSKRRHPQAPVTVSLTDLHADRVDLQRTTDAIKAQLQHFADHEPDFLTATTDSSGRTRFAVLPFPVPPTYA